MKTLTGAFSFVMGGLRHVVLRKVPASKGASINRRFGFQIFTLLLLVLSACGTALEGGTSIWIDVPLDGLNLPAIQEIKIEGHAASTQGISRVEVWINSVLLATLKDLPVEGELASFHTAWTPPGLGGYTIQAVAYDSVGVASQPDSARVMFGAVDATAAVTELPAITGMPPITISPAATGTMTPTSPPETVIQFWAEPPEIEAGACTNIRWHAENVQRVIFGGLDQPFDGSYQDCLCANQRYTLTVVLPDGKEEKRTVDIPVNGSCVTPTAVDSTPPPAPVPAVPSNGLSIACKAAQALTWLPVDDPSGIAEYQVEVQRHAGDNNWQAAPGGVLSLADKTTNLPVECGWYYRWRVRATDGAGNTGSWSGWTQFTITLG